ncbi:pyrokinin-1 receptor [Patella vulgata]|uniref:pyrokinin-1 receptor n=1 Tax=Patella vulgata TaxID=6465 RepID=UPI0024A9CC3E|nr:pyrokinin-1 receptor [Patella vulgata]
MAVNISHAILTVTLDSISNSSDVFNTYEYLNKEMGEKRQGMVAVITLTIVYCVIFVTGIVGNMSTCLVIGRNPYLHTATNYYLLSLAVSDMFTLLLGLPPELYSVWEAYPWRFGEAFCIFKSFFSEMTSYASVLTITAFTGERYVAICYPIKSQTFSNLRRAVRLIFIIWFVACICALPFPIHTRLFYYLKYPNTTQPISESLQCNIPLEWIDYMKSMFQISSFVFFVLPMGIISIMYILIGLTLKRSHFNKNSADDFCKLEAKEAARNAVIKMLGKYSQ